MRCSLGGALRRADRIIAVSEATRAEILAALYRLPPARVVVVPEAAPVQFTPPRGPALAAVRARYGLARPYVLFVGFLEPKKNLGTLLAAVARLAGRGPGATELVVVGAPGWARSARRAGPGPGRRGSLRRTGAGRRPARALRGRPRVRVPLALGGLRAARP